jgi:hypothetical protein
MRQKYDAGSKWLIDAFASELLALAGVGPFTGVRPVPNEMVQARQLPDGLVEVTLADEPKPVLFLIEISTYAYTATAAQLLDDVALTYLNKRVVPEVLALTLAARGNVRVAPNLSLQSRFGGTALEGRWRVLNLWELKARDFLKNLSPGLAPWVTLMSIDGPPEPVLQQCRDAIDTLTDPHRKENLLNVTRVFGEIRFEEALITRLFQPEGKMIESPALTRMFKQRDALAFQTALHDGIEARFGTVPVDVSAAVRAIPDDQQLRDLLKISFTVASLDEFRRALGLPQTPPEIPAN